MSDNRSAYIAHAHRHALAKLGLKHLRIRSYRPRTNGNAERFNQTLLNEWAYERTYGSSSERTAALPLFLERSQLQTTTRLTRPPTPGITTDEPRQELHLDRVGGRKHEYLDCEVRIDVVLTHEGDHFALELSFHESYQVVTHGVLVVVADLEDAIGVAIVDERALAGRERVREQDGHHAL